MFPIENATLEHALLIPCLGQRLRERLEGKPCRVATTLRVRVATSRFVYPDLVVVCGKPEFADGQTDTLINPKVIVEVLSPSTEDYDYGSKAKLYRDLPSLDAYVLVSQTVRCVEIYHRAPQHRWILSTHDTPGGSFPIEPLQIEIPIEELYAGIVPAR